MFMSDGMKDIAVATGSSAATVLLTLAARLIGKLRRRKQLSLEEAVRKELWDEIANLRAALREASATLIDWQSKALSLVNDIGQAQKVITKLSTLLTEALATLDRIEDVERHVTGDNPDLSAAKREIEVMKREVQTIRVSAALFLRS